MAVVLLPTSAGYRAQGVLPDETASEAMTTGKVVQLKITDGSKWQLADATTATPLRGLLVIDDATGDGDSISVAIAAGVLVGGYAASTFTPGAIQYLDTSSPTGDLTETRPAIEDGKSIFVVGQAIDDTSMKLVMQTLQDGETPGIDIEKDLTEVLARATDLNFEGFGLTVTDAGSKKATIKYEPDAGEVTYTPAPDNTCWDNDADPGNTGPALDQLACRVKNIEQGNNPADQNFYQFSFVYGGALSDNWLDNQEQNTNSDEVPHEVPYDGEVVAVTFANTNDGSDIILKLYHADNGTAPASTVALTWSLTNCRTARKTDLSIPVSAGDKLAMYGEGGVGFKKPSKVLVGVFIKVSPTATTSDVCQDWTGKFTI